jgi:hypothetical protein
MNHLSTRHFIHLKNYNICFPPPLQELRTFLAFMNTNEIHCPYENIQILRDNTCLKINKRKLHLSNFCALISLFHTKKPINAHLYY